MAKLYLDQHIPSGTGLHIIEVRDVFAYSHTRLMAPITKEKYPLSYRIKRWCRKSCVALYGHNSQPEYAYSSDYSSHYRTTLFVFFDESDVLSLMLQHGSENIVQKTVYSTKTLFTIIDPT